jgi:hypothetical protein
MEINTRLLNRFFKIFNEIEHKPIFVCSSQTIHLDGKTYKDMPKCDYVQISWEDWMKLHDALGRIREDVM